MKKKLFTIILILIAISHGTLLNAQVTIGANTEPNKDAVLDLISNDTKGLLLPRVELTSTTVAAPVGTTFTAGMAVYNTNTAGDVTPGYYYSDGNKWVRLANSVTIPSAWLPGGNTNGALKTIGTNDAFDFPVTVNNTEAMRVIWDGTNNTTQISRGYYRPKKSSLYQLEFHCGETIGKIDCCRW
ncbi:MAG: hypothetical protein QM751_15620 [Paludibacteraceae bacterium]